MTTTSLDTGIDNVFLLALIASASLHLTALYSRVDWFATTPAPVNVVDDVMSRVEIPIEFIPLRAQAVTQAPVPVETVRSIVEEAKQQSVGVGLVSQPAGHYSFLHRQALLKRYLGAVREEIETHKYEMVSNRGELVGNVAVNFKILSDGSFRAVNVLSTSGTAELDRAAIAAVELSSGKVKRQQATGSRTIATTAVIKYQYGL